MPQTFSDFCFLFFACFVSGLTIYCIQKGVKHIFNIKPLPHHKEYSFIHQQEINTVKFALIKNKKSKVKCKGFPAICLN